MLGIDNRGHRVRGCPSPQPSPRNGERESDRVCDTSVRNIAGAEAGGGPRGVVSA